MAVNGIFCFDMGSNVEATPGTGASIQSTVFRTGGWALKIGTGNTDIITGGLGTVFGVKFAFRKDADFTDIFASIVGGANTLTLGVDATGHLVIAASVGWGAITGTQTGPTVLVNGGWHNISWGYDNASGGVIKVWLDGRLEIDLTHSILVSAPSTFRVASPAAATVNMYIDDGKYGTDIVDYGNSRIGSRQGVAGTPTYDAFTKNVGADAAECWSETPFSATKNCSSGTLSAAQTMKVASFISGGDNPIPNASIINRVRMGMVSKSINTGSQTTNSISMRRRVGGTDTDTSVGVIPTADQWNSVTWGSNPTLAQLDNGIEIGVVRAGSGTQSTQVEDMWLHVDYSPRVEITVGQVTESETTFAATAQVLGSGLKKKVGNFTSPVTTGSVTYSGLGFTPKAIMFFSNEKIDAVGADAVMMIGTATKRGGTVQQWVCSIHDNDAVATSQTVRGRNVGQCVQIMQDNATTSAIAAEFVDFTSDGFTLNWTTANEALPIFFVAFGGSAVQDAYAGFKDTRSGTGSQSITDPGFQPNLLFTAASRTVNTSEGNGVDVASIMFGCVGNAKQWVNATIEESAASTKHAYHYTSNARCGNLLGTGSGATVMQFAWTSFDVSGFTINQTTAAASARWCYLALKIDGSIDTGTDQQKITSTGTKAKTGLGFQPELMLLNMTAKSALDGTSSVHLRFSVGATDGTNQFMLALSDRDAGTGNTEAKGAASTSKILRSQSGTGPTISGEAAFSSFDADGYTLNFTTVDATARFFCYVALKGNAAVTSHSYDVGQVLDSTTTFAVTRQKQRTVGQSTDTATLFSVVPKKSRSVGQTLEHDTLFAVTKTKSKTVGQTLEHDTLFAVTKRRAFTVGQALESSTVFSITKRKNRSAGLVLEHDTLFAVARKKNRAAGLVTEATTTQPIIGTKRRTVGQSVDTESEQTVETTFVHAVGLATDGELVQSAVAVKSVPAAQSTDAETAQLAIVARVFLVGQSVDGETVLSVATSKSSGGGQALETEIGLSQTAQKGIALYVAPEAAETLSISIAKGIDVNQATDTSRVFVVSVRTGRQVGWAEEIEENNSIGKRKGYSVGQSETVDTNFSAVPEKHALAVPAIESELVSTIFVFKSRSAAIVEESESAHAAIARKTFGVDFATETDNAFPTVNFNGIPPNFPAYVSAVWNNYGSIPVVWKRNDSLRGEFE